MANVSIENMSSINNDYTHQNHKEHSLHIFKMATMKNRECKTLKMVQIIRGKLEDSVGGHAVMFHSPTFWSYLPPVCSTM